jgi:hypothetical protein
VLSLSFPGAQGTHAVYVTARKTGTAPHFPLEKRAQSLVFPHAGEFSPRIGYPIVNGTDFQEKREFLKRVVLVGKEPVTVDIPIAFNDPPGDYEISVTELFSNKTVTKKLNVQ